MDFKGRRVPERIAVFLRLLSNKASTDSCSIRFSFRKMTSGALISINCFKRLLRMMIRRYRSFKSLAAKRPPSRGTSGLNSGGMTGKTDTTIHSGLFTFFLSTVGNNALATFNRFRASPRFCFEREVSMISTRSFFSWIIFNRDSNSLRASPPMAA